MSAAVTQLRSGARAARRRLPRFLGGRPHRPPDEEVEVLGAALQGYLFGAHVKPGHRKGIGFLRVELEGLPAWFMVPEPGLALAWHEANGGGHKKGRS